MFRASLPHPHQMPLIYSFIYQFFINTNYVLETVPGGGGGGLTRETKEGEKHPCPLLEVRQMYTIYKTNN